MFSVEVEQEDDGLAEITDLRGAMAYSATRQEAISSAEALVLRVLAERLEHGEPLPERWLMNSPRR